MDIDDAVNCRASSNIPYDDAGRNRVNARLNPCNDDLDTSVRVLRVVSLKPHNISHLRIGQAADRYLETEEAVFAAFEANLLDARKVSTLVLLLKPGA